MKKENVPRNSNSGLADSAEEKTENPKLLQFPIVGIGTSAGGLEALEQFFINMPGNSGMAFVVIQHLSPDHKALLSELLQRITKMEVCTVTDRLKVKPNCVYVIPSNKSMSILNGTLHLFDPVESHGLRLPIDFFFRSLADDMKEQSVGIILSGMGSDGSIGLKAIKEKAGRALVQEPATAKFDSMPRSAMDAVVVDVVAPVNELPVKLFNLIHQTPLAATKEELEKDTSELDKIIILLRSQTGNDFSQYKKNTLYRRVERRMEVHQIKKIATYVRYLQENPAEANILFKELLIGVTNFFRDAAVWEKLRDEVFPAIFAKSPSSSILRAWVPGCSTGEEAYSLAMVFKEALGKTNTGKNLTLQVFATDLDSNAIEKARKGIFPENIIIDVSPERLERFFSKTNERFRVNTEIREMIIFAPQNVTKDPPFTKLDVLSCRNLLIYMNADLQKSLLSQFHYSLNPEGFLLLGSSETHGSQSGLFSTFNSKLRIYQRLGQSRKEDFFTFPVSFPYKKTEEIEDQLPKTNGLTVQALTEQLLLQQFSPASVLVTDKGDILYLTGNINKFLSLASGKANMNIFAMAPEGLINELPSAFRKAKQNFEKVVLRHLKIKTNEGIQLIDVTIQQIDKPLALKNKLIVIFTEGSAADLTTSKRKNKARNKAIETDFEVELQRFKEDLESTREEMQTSQEELRSANEELQSTNEELQSTNEELTTSKEEMQSLNEELQTVNVELQGKIDDSVRVNNDMDNLLNSIEIATLFLDRELNIRQFTVPTTKIFKLKQSDIGRLFTDQVTHLNYPEMYNHASEVLHSEISMEKEVSTCDGRWFNVRIMPYRTFENKIDGLVITFIDITKLKQLEDAQKESQSMFHVFAKDLPIGVVSLSLDGSIIEINREAEKLFGFKQNEVTGKSFFDLVKPHSSNGVEKDTKKFRDGIFSNLSEFHFKSVDGNIITIKWSSHKSQNGQEVKIGLANIGAYVTN